MLNNPLANMYGPLFLLLYAGVLGMVFYFCRRAIRQTASDLAEAQPPSISNKVSPYEIAYLRGGVNEVARTAVFGLIHRGALTRTQDAKRPWLSQVSQADPEQVAQAGKLDDVEDQVFRWFDSPKSPKDMFSKRGLPQLIDPSCDEFQSRLVEQGLLRSSDELSAANRIFTVGLLVILGLGSFKLSVALAKGFTNVGFLIMMMILGVFVQIILMVRYKARQTTRGKAYVKSLQIAYQDKKPKPQSSSSTPDSSYNPALDTMLPLMVGLYGVSALAHTQYSDVNNMFRAGAQTGAAGCGNTGSGCSSGSGGGGDSGGGSSCGGGGGCGGCGGGGS